ncbi:carbon monoxide dehydrogenase large subunit, partial [mine drainage metagenome]
MAVKGGLYSEYALAAFLAKKTGKPVKWIESRREHLMASRPGRGASAFVKLYANKSGRILGMKGKVIIDSGAYSGGSGEFAASFVGMQMTGPYKIENAYVEAYPVFTNKVVQGPYRGAGRPEAHFFIERMIDMLADKLKMDPVDVRLINTVNSEFKSPLGIDVPPAKEFLEDAISKLNYRKLYKEKPGFSF